jgi:hypothetical protein
VVALLGPIEAHEVEDLEELLEVEVLLRADDVEHLLEAIRPMTPDGRRNITSDVEGGAIGLLDDDLAELVFLCGK